MLRRIILYFTVCAIAAGSLFGCENIVGPDFPDTPRISFQSVRKFRVKDRLGNATDSVSIALKFQDGDGDLGLTIEEVTENPTNYNYFVQAFRKVKGEYTEVVFTPTLSGQFPVLNEGKKGPIEGTLYYGTLFPILFSPANDTLRFNVYILDRAGNQSNIVTTEDVVVNEK